MDNQKIKQTKVIGIDPAPSKKNTIFDGDEFCQKNYNELEIYLKEIKNGEDNVLICWDAPLSFNYKEVTLYTRKIESYFAKLKLPKGISVRGYAGCPHWTISQFLLGYPRISNFDTGFNPPFELVFNKDKITKSITEVHPAVAIWIWLKDDSSWTSANWEYKKNSKTLNEVKAAIEIDPAIKNKIKTDDQLDAYIAWRLGRDWIDGNGVCILGDNSTGSFLLPYNEKIFKPFLVRAS